MFVDFGAGVTPTMVVSSYRLISSPVGIVTRQTRRRYWGIALKAGGKTFYKQDENEILSDAYHVVLLPKGAAYQWTCVEPGDCIVIDFDALEEGDTIRMVEISDNSPITSAFTKLERLMNTESVTDQLEAMHLLYGLLLYLTKSQKKRYYPKGKQKSLAPAVNYMIENYADPRITNDMLADLCGMSTVYFRKTFEAVYNNAPIRYLHNLRTQKAKAILSGDFDSVGQVAESVGYSSVYHFSKMFKVYTGESPSVYAKQRKK